MTTPEETQANYGELSVIELTQKVNEEYYQIYSHDRTDYPRAVMIGEMLNNIRPRVAKHGQWQNWLKENCPKISYETANIYMRVAKGQVRILKAAAAKNVAATDLTIAFARDVLNTPKPKGEMKKEPKQPELPTKSSTPVGGVMPDDADGEDGGYNDDDFAVDLANRAADEIFPLLKCWDVDELRKLHALIGDHIAKLGACLFSCCGS
jgi:hypothetical protein